MRPNRNPITPVLPTRNPRNNSNNGRMNFAQQGEMALKNDRIIYPEQEKRSNSYTRPVTQQEIRSALTLLKSKQKPKVDAFYIEPKEIYEPPPPLKKAQSEVPKQEITYNQPSKYPPIEPQEYEEDNEPLEECPEGCGRKFKYQALQKHVKVCKKVFQQQRKKFDMKEQRIIGQDHAQLLHEAEIKEKMEQKQQQKKVDNRPIQGQKKAKWKAQSDAFRAMVKMNKGAEMTAQERIAYDEAVQDDRVQCDYCGRKFQAQTAQKHIPSCQQKAKATQIKNGTAKRPFQKK